MQPERAQACKQRASEVRRGARWRWAGHATCRPLPGLGQAFRGAATRAARRPVPLPRFGRCGPACTAVWGEWGEVTVSFGSRAATAAQDTVSPGDSYSPDIALLLVQGGRAEGWSSPAEPAAALPAQWRPL